MMGLIATEAISRYSVPSVSAGPAPEWVESNKPFPAFAMTAPEFEEAPRYAIWRHPDGGGRKDILTFGDAASGGATAVDREHAAGNGDRCAYEAAAAGEPDGRAVGAGRARGGALPERRSREQPESEQFGGLELHGAVLLW